MGLTLKTLGALHMHFISLEKRSESWGGKHALPSKEW